MTEFSAHIVTDGIAEHVIIRAENGDAGFTSYWRPEQIEDYGLVEICEMVERAMWRAHKALRKSMEPSDPSRHVTKSYATRPWG